MSDLKEKAKELAKSLRAQAEGLKKGNFEEVRDGLITALKLAARAVEMEAVMLEQIKDCFELQLQIVHQLNEGGAK